MDLAIIDLELGNIGSVFNMLKHLGHAPKIITEPDDLLSADKIILPGVGSFDVCVAKLDNNGWRHAIETMVLEKNTPILGICLGMQVLCFDSEEGVGRGLSLIDGHCVKFDGEKHADIRVPHMGWNMVDARGSKELMQGLETRNKFYFTHSYHMVLEHQSDCGGATIYGDEFVSVVTKENIFGVQFHPEKSHSYGKKLLNNFVMHNA